MIISSNKIILINYLLLILNLINSSNIVDTINIISPIYLLVKFGIKIRTPDIKYIILVILFIYPSL